MTRLSAQDKRWEAESDARALAEAIKIQNTPARFNAAKKAAGRLAEEQRVEAEALKKIEVSGRKPGRVSPASVTKKPNFRRKKKG